MRRCNRCGSERHAEDFYASTPNTCRYCVCAAVKVRRLEKLDQVRAYDRERAKLPHRIANAMMVTREWRRKHKDRMAAHNKANRAGLMAPKACEGCGLNKRLDKHHPDYSKPLLVVWLCKPCHAIADKIRRRLEAS